MREDHHLDVAVVVTGGMMLIMLGDDLVLGLILDLGVSVVRILEVTRSSLLCDVDTACADVFF